MLVDRFAPGNNALFRVLFQMAAAILQSTQYERLAEQCDLRADLTRLTGEREFYREQATIFRRLAKLRERRDAAGNGTALAAARNQRLQRML